MCAQNPISLVPTASIKSNCAQNPISSVPISSSKFKVHPKPHLFSTYDSKYKVKLRPKAHQFSTYFKLKIQSAPKIPSVQHLQQVRNSKCTQTPFSSVPIACINQIAPKIPSVKYLQQVRNSKCTQIPIYLKVVCIINSIYFILLHPKSHLFSRQCAQNPFYLSP